jgi:hypothetical protein
MRKRVFEGIKGVLVCVRPWYNIRYLIMNEIVKTGEER